MSEMYALNETAMTLLGRLALPDGDFLTRVMSVLQDIRPWQSNGLAYQATSNLADSGFTSVEMVKVMLGIEAAFDVMIPQDLITPENFASATAISAMMVRII